MPRQREVEAEDHIRQSPPLDLDARADFETIPQWRSDEIELEAFMNEPVTIVIADSTDENAPPMVEVSINGRRIIIPRNVPTTVRRMYVERLARAKKTTYSQNLDPTLGEGINKLQRRRALDYPFAVTDDANPNGREWLKRILAEA